MLNVTMRAHPNRGVTSAKVMGALLVSRPFAVVLLILIFLPKKPNMVIVIASIVRCNFMQMGIMLRPQVHSIIQQFTRLEELVLNKLPHKFLTKMNQVGHNLGVPGLVNKVVDDNVVINLHDGKEKGKYLIRPTVGGPGSFEAWAGMMGIVVINGMTKFEMPLKGFGIVEGGGLILVVGVLPKLLHLPSIDRGEQPPVAMMFMQYSGSFMHQILYLMPSRMPEIASTLPTAFSLKYSRMCSPGMRVGQYLPFLSTRQQKHPFSSTPPTHAKHRTHYQEQCIDLNGTST